MQVRTKLIRVGAVGIGAPLAFPELKFGVELWFWIGLLTDIAGDCILSELGRRMGVHKNGFLCTPLYDSFTLRLGVLECVL